MTTPDLHDLGADLASHHIEGISYYGEAPFEVPLVSHIVGNLWTGGCIDGVRLPDDFLHVVSLYPWERYEIGPGTRRVEARLYDAAEIANQGEIYSLAGYVLYCLREGTTLVHCQAGLNRSSLVAGLALILSGMPPREAVELLQERRCPLALCNPTFYDWLLQQEQRPIR